MKEKKYKIGDKVTTCGFGFGEIIDIEDNVATVSFVCNCSSGGTMDFPFDELESITEQEYDKFMKKIFDV